VIENDLLAAVPRRVYRDLLAGLEPVALESGEVLYEPGRTIQHVYLPGTSLISLLTNGGLQPFHLVEQRLARWLLMTQDRVKSDQFLMTHE
jgi:hypothetical protein